MTRKDYELIARALESALPKHRLHDLPEDVWLDCVESVAVALATDNPQFNHDRFLVACKTPLTYGKVRDLTAQDLDLEDGTSGQDRKSYSDTQDRKSYSAE